MNLIKLDKLPGQDSMLIFHVLARIGYEGLVIVSPSKPQQRKSTLNSARMLVSR
jgi:hypothetical protein